LENRGIALRLEEARASVRDILRTEDLEEIVSPIDRFTTLTAAIEASSTADK
jgi:hypothetical protein